MAFDFPPAQNGLRVTNPESGVTYVYRDQYQAWIIEGVDNHQVKVLIGCCTPCEAHQGDLWFSPCTNCLNVYVDREWLPVADCTNGGDYLNFRGEVDRPEKLPGKGVEVGDVYIVLNEMALYTWSSNGWLPADRYDDSKIWDALEKEREKRKEQDQAIRQELRQEVEDRKEGDQKLWDALKQEEEDRLAADEALQKQIYECCTENTEGISDLSDRLDQEIADRIDGDQKLDDKLHEHELEIKELEEQLGEEVQARIDGDLRLEQLIEDEAEQREAEDDALRALIAATESKYMGEVATKDDLPTTRYIWRPITDFKCETVYSITHGPSRFIAGSSSGHAWSSEDGQYWQRRNVGVAFNGKVLATAYASGLWLIGGENGLVSRSVDGLSWSNVVSTTNGNIQCFAYGKGTWVYGTDNGVVATSSDGVSWTKQDHTIAWGSHGFDSIEALTFVPLLSRFVAVTGRGMVLISDTGVGWSLIDPGLRGSGKLLAITAIERNGKPLLVAGGDFPERLIYSEDSLSWQAAITNPFGSAVVTDLAGYDEVITAALSDGRVAWARDDRARQWIVELLGCDERMLAIAHGPSGGEIAIPEGIFVTGGNFGKVFVRLPGNGLEPGDTWIVLDEMCLYTWSSNGWITSCGDSSGGGGSGGAINTRAVDLIPPGKRTSELFPLTDEETLALSDLMPPLGAMSTQEDYNAWILKALGILATCPCSKVSVLDGTDAEWNSQDPSIMSLDGGDALSALPENTSPVV